MNWLKEVIEYSFPTQIFFGAGSRKLLCEKLSSEGIKRPLIVTDKKIQGLDFISDIKDDLQKKFFEVEIFSDISGDPLESHVKKGSEAYIALERDGVIAVGGGAVVDVAKAILLMVDHPGELFEYEDGKADAPPIKNKMPYFVAIPTTAGTGSEVGRSTVISDDTTKVKKIIFSPYLLPKLVLADPELTLKLPAEITASTGMDALTHCIEAYLAKTFHPICEGIALEGIRLIGKSLRKCVDFARNNFPENEEHLTHRGLMLNASMMGAIAFQKGLGVTHSCAHSLSTIFNLHHGLANGIMLPVAMRYNAKTQEEKFSIMSKTLELAEKNSEGFIQFLENLRKETGIPEKLSDLDLPESRIDDLVEYALQDICHSLNPRKVSRQDFRDLFANAF